MKKSTAAVFAFGRRLVQRDVLILRWRPPRINDGRVAQIWILHASVLVSEVVSALRTSYLQNVAARLPLIRALYIPGRDHLVYCKEVGLDSF
jgi:hypothetical protein